MPANCHKLVSKFRCTQYINSQPRATQSVLYLFSLPISVLMFSRKYFSLFYITALSLFSSCTTYTPIQFKKVEKIELNTDKLTSGFELSIYNPNSSGLKLRNAEAEFYLSDRSIGKASLQKAMRIPPGSEILIPFDLKINYANLPDLLPFAFKLLLGNTPGEITVGGNIKIRKFLWYKKINFELKQKIDKEVLKNLKF